MRCKNQTRCGHLDFCCEEFLIGLLSFTCSLSDAVTKCKQTDLSRILLLKDTVDSLIEGEVGRMNSYKKSKSTKRQRTKSCPNKEKDSWKKQCQSNLDDFVLVNRRKGKHNNKSSKLDSDVDAENEDLLEGFLDEHSGDYLEQFPEIPEDLVAEYKAETQVENQNSLYDNSIDLTAEEKEYHTPIIAMTDTVRSTESVRQSVRQAIRQSTSTPQQSLQQSQTSSQISPQITPQQSPQLLSQQQSHDKEHPGGIVVTQLDNHGNLLKQILENQQQMQGNISKLDAHLSAINQGISQQAASIHDLEQRVVSLETSEPNGQIEKLQRLEEHVNPVSCQSLEFHERFG